MGYKESLFKFSQIGPQEWNVGAALFTLQNMGALQRKLEKGDFGPVLNMLEIATMAYLKEAGAEPPAPDYTPPVEQSSGDGWL